MKRKSNKPVLALFFTIWAFSTLLQAQDPNTLKTAGIGFSSCTSVNSKMPGIAMTPYGFVRDRVHMVFAGLDIFPGSSFGKIKGFQFGYRYYTEKGSSNIQIYFEGNIQMCKFGTGIGPRVPYNYLPTDSVFQMYNMLRANSFLNTYGIGLDMKVSKRLRVEITGAGGYNYVKSSYSPLNVAELNLTDLKLGGNFRPVLFARIGAYVQIYKKHSD